MTRSRVVLAAPIVFSVALLVSACGGGTGATVAQQPVGPARPAAPAAPAPVAAPAAAQPAAPRVNTAAAPVSKSNDAAGRAVATVRSEPVTKPAKAGASAATERTTSATGRRTAVAAANQAAYEQKNGATDVGVTKDQIKLGSINMHGMALGNVVTEPVVRGNLGATAAINDRGGVLGRRLVISDCDDGPGEVSRAKSCIKKLVGQDHIFSMITGIDWATASIHDDLKQYHMPYVGAWAYSQTEWQDPFMFPTHMSMIHEAMAGAHWAVNVIHPKTYGLICLTSPEMQLACNQVQQVVDASGAKMVKRANVSISETSMSAYVLAFRAANPEHIIHYVINPATVVKFMVEAEQQGYFPPKGISGNHLAAEALGSFFGKWPVGRYWTNTTYKLWGAEFIATMDKYARGNTGFNHHIVQAGYVAVNIFAQAAKAVGPNLTRDRLMAEIGNGTVWAADADLDQRFSYAQSERTGTNWNHNYGQGREFIYKYVNVNTRANPDGSANGWELDPGQGVIYTWK
jgi:hypothetical protein